MSTKKFTHNGMLFKVKVKTCNDDSQVSACRKCVFENSSELCLAAPECDPDDYFKIKSISTE